MKFEKYVFGSSITIFLRNPWLGTSTIFLHCLHVPRIPNSLPFPNIQFFSRLRRRADLLLRLGRPKAARRDCSAALALNPDSGKASRKIVEVQFKEVILGFVVGAWGRGSVSCHSARLTAQRPRKSALKQIVNMKKSKKLAECRTLNPRLVGVCKQRVPCSFRVDSEEIPSNPLQPV